MGMPAVLALTASVGVGLLIRKQQVRSRNLGSAMTAPEIGSPARVARSVTDNVMLFQHQCHGMGAELLDRRSTADRVAGSAAVNRPFTLAQSISPSAKG